MASPSSRTDPVKIRSTATTTLCELVSPTVSWKLASRCRSIPLSPPRAITETGRRWSGHVTHTCFVWLCHICLFFGVWSCHTFVLGQAMSNVFVCVFWSGYVIFFFFLGPVTSPMFFCLVVSHVFLVGHVIHGFCLFGYVTFFGLVMWLFSCLFFSWSCHFWFFGFIFCLVMLFVSFFFWSGHVPCFLFGCVTHVFGWSCHAWFFGHVTFFGLVMWHLKNKLPGHVTHVFVVVVNVRKEVSEHLNSFHPICKPVIAVDIFHTGAVSISVKSGWWKLVRQSL